MIADPISWTYYNPVRIHAGKGMLSTLPALVAHPGCWLLITSPGFTSRGVVDRVRQLLGSKADVRLHVHDRIEPNPELAAIDALANELSGLAPAGLIALGGGSAIDAGKVLSLALAGRRPRSAADLLASDQSAASPRLPLIAIPTSAGTGAEITPFATIWDRSGMRKLSASGDAFFPQACLLDPELTLSLPERETLHSGLDALSHALESLWNRHRTPMSMVFSRRALELIVDALPAVLAAPLSLDKRRDMQQASLFAGMAISHTRTALAHAISYPLTLHHGVPHGLACSFTLEALLGKDIETIAAAGVPYQLLEQTLAMLRSLDLRSRIRQYASQHEILALLPQMTTPSRAGNYPFQADIASIIRASTT